MKKYTRKEKKRLFSIFGCVLSVGLLLIVCSFFMDGAKDVADQYAYGMKTFSAETIVDLYKEEMILESYNSKKEMIKDYEEMFEELKDDYYRIEDYEISDNFKIFKDEEFKYKQDQLYEYYGIDKKLIEQIRLYTVKYECNEDGEEKNTEQGILVARIDGKWYYIGNE
jgi:hypothetical protein